MEERTIEKEIDLAVNYYTKGEKREQLKTFINSIINKVKNGTD